MTRPSVRDHSSLQAKLELRRCMLSQFGSKYNLNVLDCCAGKGFIWNKLRDEFQINSYFSIDKKRKAKANIRTDSVRWLKHVKLTANVIDIDTYGEPWRHYEVLLSIDWPQPEILVFLTLGAGRKAAGNISRTALQLAGLKPEWDKLFPRSEKLQKIITSSCLTTACKYGIIIHDGMEGKVEGINTKYFGLWLERRKSEPHPNRMDGEIVESSHRM